MEGGFVGRWRPINSPTASQISNWRQVLTLSVFVFRGLGVLGCWGYVSNVALLFLPGETI